MRKKTWLFISMSVFVLLIVAACGSAETPALPEEPAVTEAPAGGGEAAPESEVQSATGEQAPESEGAYPAPQPIEFIQPDPYPTPVQAESIDWAEMENFIQSGEVAQVLQTPTKLIVITMADGTLYTSTEPEKDDIFKLLDECGASCNGIRRLSEW